MAIFKMFWYVCNRMGLGQNIKRFREAMELSQEDVAKFLGIHRELISYFENETRKPPLEILEKLSGLFGVEVMDIVSETATTSNKVGLAFAFRSSSLSPEDLRVIGEFKKVVRNYIKLVELKERNERAL